MAQALVIGASRGLGLSPYRAAGRREVSAGLTEAANGSFCDDDGQPLAW